MLTHSPWSAIGAARGPASQLARRQGLGRVHGRGDQGAQREAVQPRVPPVGQPGAKARQRHQHGTRY